MTKYEFIEELQRALTGRINPSELAETSKYYEDYIDSEIKKGRTEDEVLVKLGDPRLLAKSIAAANSAETYNHDETYNKNQAWDESGRGSRRRKIPVWVYILAVILVVFLIIGMVTRLIWYYFPIVFPVLFILWCIRTFRRR